MQSRLCGFSPSALPTFLFTCYTLPAKSDLSPSLISSMITHMSQGQKASPQVSFLVSLHTCMHAKSLQFVQLFMTPWTATHQAPLSMGFSRQEYLSGLPCPPSGDLPDPRIELSFLISPVLTGRFFTTTAAWKPYVSLTNHFISSSLSPHITKWM